MIVVFPSPVATRLSMSQDRMKKVTNHSLADQARDMIRNAIFEGKIKPEERLTIERIAAEMGISRTPVREALKSLEADGIVKLLPHRGAVVQRFDEAEIHDRYSVRATLEGYAGELACTLRAEALVLELEANCLAAETLMAAGVPSDNLDAVGALMSLNGQFYDLIFQASGSAVTVRLLEALRMPLAYRLYHWRDAERQQGSLKFHRDIIEALRDRKPKRVRKLLEDRLHEARDYILARN
jgi:DNA-binding GntR family transcriptional regulator